MYIEQIYTSCLSEASYYIESDGFAAVIDPLRDTDQYIALASSRKAKIKYIIETHFHADFVSGHLELAKQTGATIVYGPEAETKFEKYSAEDGEVLQLGKITLTVLHTPGHTLESSCFLLKDESGKDHCVFTGDTLFVGDVGRPDLFSGNLTKEVLAGKLFDSLQQKIKTLNDDVIVYPAHGPGSSCGKSLGKETFSTIGIQKATNYALRHTNKSDFVKEVTTGLVAPPAYFPINAGINKGGYKLMHESLAVSYKALNVSEFESKQKEGTIIIDTRTADEFTAGFIPSAIFIGLDGRFAEWAGSLLPFDKDLIVVAPEGKETETAIRLSRVGLDRVVGYLEGGFMAWQSAGKPIDLVINIDADELKMDLQFDPIKTAVVDVRKPTEFENGHIDVAENFPLSSLEAEFKDLPKSKNLYIHCAGGYRSVIAISLLKRHHVHHLRNVLGGYSAITKVPGMPLAVQTAKALMN